MSALGKLGFSLVERGLFDPANTSEAAVYASWVTLCAVCYGLIASKHKLDRRDYGILLLGLIMPPYALRYVFFGTRWGSNSSFSMVNTLFTSLCPANILLPCPADDPVNCQLSFPKLRQRSIQQLSQSGHCPFGTKQLSHGSNYSQVLDHQHDLLPSFVYNSSASGFVSDSHKLSRQHLQFPVLVPLWQIYVRERPLPIYLHTSCMTISSLLWPLQLWKSFRQRHLKLHRKLGYLAVAATALGSLAGAPYAISYLCSSDLPAQITGLGYLAMYSFASRFMVTGIQAARKKNIVQHKLNMVRLVGLGWGVSPLGRLLTVMPPIIFFTGPWNNAAVVCLSWPLGIFLAQQSLL